MLSKIRICEIKNFVLPVHLGSRTVFSLGPPYTWTASQRRKRFPPLGVDGIATQKCEKKANDTSRAPRTEHAHHGARYPRVTLGWGDCRKNYESLP